MTKEALKLALEALVLNNAEWKHLADSGDSGYWSAEDQNHYKQTEQAITAVQRVLANEALEKMAENARELGLDYEPEQEPVAWVDLLKEAQQIVESKVLWKRFIDGTPLSNDIACWMAAFAQQHTAPPQRTWVGLTDEEMQSIAFESADALSAVFVAEAKLKDKNNV